MFAKITNLYIILKIIFNSFNNYFDRHYSKYICFPQNRNTVLPYLIPPAQSLKTILKKNFNQKRKIPYATLHNQKNFSN